MVDVIQVPIYTESIFFIYVMLSALIFGFVALASFIIILFRRDYKELLLKVGNMESNTGNRTKDILMLLALTSGRYDMLKRLLTYETVTGKGNVSENIAQIMKDMQDGGVFGSSLADDGMPGHVEPKDIINQSTEMIKDNVLVEVSEKLKNQLKEKLELEIKKNIYKRYGIAL